MEVIRTLQAGFTKEYNGGYSDFRGFFYKTVQWRSFRLYRLVLQKSIMEVIWTLEACCTKEYNGGHSDFTGWLYKRV